VSPLNRIFHRHRIVGKIPLAKFALVRPEKHAEIRAGPSGVLQRLRLDACEAKVLQRAREGAGKAGKARNIPKVCQRRFTRDGCG
jgi:hypothetical protein